jgi:multidrug efflux pump
VLTLAITSSSMPLSQVEDLVDTRLAPKISQLKRRRPGQHQRRPEAGGAHPGQPHGALLLRHQPGRPAHRADAGQRQRAAKGNFDGPRQDYQIDANDQLVTSTTIASVVVAYRNGAPVMLTDVANIVDGVENNKQAAWMNQTPAVISTCSASPAPTPSAWSRASRSCCRS